MLINRKLPSCVIDKIMIYWVGIFVVMETMFFFNGGEFTAEEIKNNN